MSSFDLEKFWREQKADHLAAAQATFDELADVFGQWLDISENAVRAGGKLMFFGNGGSAADAQHIAAELAVKLSQPRDPIAALCLTLDPSAMTATGNDFGFAHIFARQLHALGKPEDVAVGISTSGNSPNVLVCLDKARGMGMTTVGLSGHTGGQMAEHCDILLTVPSKVTARIQEMHILLGHTFCGALEQRLGLV